MTSLSKNVYNDKLDDVFNKYNNTYHRAIKMKPFDVKPSTYIDSSKENNDKDPPLELVILLECQNIEICFAKGCTPNGSEEVFVIKNVINTVPWTHVINDLNGEEIVGTFYEKDFKKQIKKNLKLKK